MHNYLVADFEEYERRRDSHEWSSYLSARQSALQEYAKRCDGRVSARDACGPEIVSAWDHCFNEVRDPMVPWCRFCAEAPLACQSGDARVWERTGACPSASAARTNSPARWPRPKGIARG